jgi:hypothetical protein
MAVERVTAFEVFDEHRIGFVAPELLEACGMDVAVHAGAERAALEAVAAQDLGVEAGQGSAGLVIRATVPASIARAPTRGRGVLLPSRPLGGIQIRRNTAPSAIPAASCQDRKARIGQSSVVP